MDGMFFSNLDDVPEPMRSAIKQIIEARDAASMHVEANVRDWSRFLSEASVEELLMLANIFNSIGHAEDPAAAAAFENGRISSILEFKHEVCPGCGVDHDGEATASLLSEEGNVNNVDDITPGDKQVPPGDQHFDDTDEVMEMYRVVASPQDHNPERVTCKDCGYHYPSLADRMVKSPDDCVGCHHKAAHG